MCLQKLVLIFSNKNALKLIFKKMRGGGSIWAFEKSNIPVIEDFGRGKTVIGPKTLGTTVLQYQ